jgi:hypothetical protein
VADSGSLRTQTSTSDIPVINVVAVRTRHNWQLEYVCPWGGLFQCHPPSHYRGGTCKEPRHGRARNNDCCQQGDPSSVNLRGRRFVDASVELAAGRWIA